VLEKEERRDAWCDPIHGFASLRVLPRRANLEIAASCPRWASGRVHAKRHADNPCATTRTYAERNSYPRVHIRVPLREQLEQRMREAEI